MSAETLRRAAALMRERAEAARAGRWYAQGTDVLAAWETPRFITSCDGSAVPEGNVANAAHIASMGPGVASALATLLEDLAWRFECDQRAFDNLIEAGETPTWSPHVNKAALILARDYLGENQ